MKKWLWIALVGIAAVTAIVLGDRMRSPGGRSARDRASEVDRAEGLALDEITAAVGRRRAEATAEARPLPEALRDGVPRNAAELASYVERLRALGHDELLRLSNAEYDFEDSELIELLQKLEGDWVVQALGELAVREDDPLLRAILVKGLAGGFSYERVDDPEWLPVLESLVVRMSAASEDPHRVANDLAAGTFDACVRRKLAYPEWMTAQLARSDNPVLLSHGYLYMGALPGGEEMLKTQLTAHPSANGRFGALEGLRSAGTDGRVPPEEVTALGLAALASETDARNRLLLLEMMGSAGGEPGLAALEDVARRGTPEEVRQSVQMLALRAEPERALALAQEVLAARELDAETRAAVYSALGSLEGDEGEALLLAVVRDVEQDPAHRMDGLRGLWNRPMDEELGAELATLFETSDDPELRLEAMRMLSSGEEPVAGLDLREVGALDEDPEVRSEAVMLAALEAGGDSRAWLEERLHQDDSLEVKAAALGGLVMHAHYTGDGDEVLGYLERARKLSFDDETRTMIAEGERMVREHDPRRLELELAKEAEFWATVSQHTGSGAARRGFERQSRMLQRMVDTLRAGKR